MARPPAPRRGDARERCYLRSCRTVCGTAFAWASMAVPACWRICARVKLIISEAMSVSRMRDSEAERFSVVTERFEIVRSNRFWKAPRLPRRVETVVIALSIDVMFAAELVALDTSTALRPSDAVRMSPMEMLIWSDDEVPEPTWNVPPLPEMVLLVGLAR